jgi:uncharacterized protein YdeI (BOF family)
MRRGDVWQTGCFPNREEEYLPEDLMKNRVQALCFIMALVLLLGMSAALSAQQNTAQTQRAGPQSQQQQPSQQEPPDQSGQQAPDAQAQSSQPEGTQTFTGTIVKAGDKYMFQDDASGNTYDIDHQNEVQKYEGKKVKVHGVLDANAKMIHLQ